MSYDRSGVHATESLGSAVQPKMCSTLAPHTIRPQSIKEMDDEIHI